jgi:hypothetical protein
MTSPNETNEDSKNEVVLTRDERNDGAEVNLEEDCLNKPPSAQSRKPFSSSAVSSPGTIINNENSRPSFRSSLRWAMRSSARLNAASEEEMLVRIVDLRYADDDHHRRRRRRRLSNNGDGDDGSSTSSKSLFIKEESRAKRNRIGLFIFTALYTALFAGAYLGFGPMQLFLEEDGAFSKECAGEEVCPEQSARLIEVVLVSQVTSALSPGLGWVADRFGSLALMNLLGLSACAGISLLVLASWFKIYELLYLGFILIGIMFVSTSIMTVQTGVVFQGKARRRVISLLNNLLDAGAVTYLFLYEISKATGASFVAITGGYLGLAVLCFGGAAYFWWAVAKDIEIRASMLSDEVPKMKRPSETLQEQEKTEFSTEHESDKRSEIFAAWTGVSSHHLEGNLNEQEMSAFWRNVNSIGGGSNEQNSSTVEYQLIAKRPSKDQLRSKQYICVALLFLCHDARTAFIAATARDFLASLGDDEHDNFYLSLFTYINVASLVALPFTDKLLEKWGYHAAFQIINVMALLNGVVQVASDDLNIQVIGFVIFSFYRSLTFSAIFSFMPVFLGGDVVGRGVGVMTFLAGIFGLINIPLASVSLENLDGDFFYANLFYLLLVAPPLCRSLDHWTRNQKGRSCSSQRI